MDISQLGGEGGGICTGALAMDAGGRQRRRRSLMRN